MMSGKSCFNCGSDHLARECLEGGGFGKSWVHYADARWLAFTRPEGPPLPQETKWVSQVRAQSLLRHSKRWDSEADYRNDRASLGWVRHGACTVMRLPGQALGALGQEKGWRRRQGCFKHGGGHWARECPEGSSGGYGGGYVCGFRANPSAASSVPCHGRPLREGADGGDARALPLQRHSACCPWSFQRTRLTQCSCSLRECTRPRRAPRHRGGPTPVGVARAAAAT